MVIPLPVWPRTYPSFSRVPRDATAFDHRIEGFNFLVIGGWLEATENEANIAWARDTYDAMAPFYTTGAYSNYMTEDEGQERVHAAYGANFDRLRALKGQYDPDNTFHLNQNIAPG